MFSYSDPLLKPFSRYPRPKVPIIERLQAILSDPASPDVPRLEAEIYQLVDGLYRRPPFSLFEIT